MNLSKVSLPVMQCDAGCNSCCTVILCQPHEAQAVHDYAREHGVVPKRQGLQCPYFQEGRCQVYPVRPFVCRLFGHVPRLECPRGYNTNVPKALERKLVKDYGTPTECLHEVLGEDWLNVVVHTEKL